MDVVTLGMAKAELKKNTGATIYPAGASDHTARINAALSAAATTAGRKRVQLIGAFTISAPLVIPSDTTLDATNATVTLTNGSNCNMAQTEAHAPVRTVADAALSGASTTLTSATAAFTGADVGRPVYIAGAGTTAGQGGLKGLYTTIVSVESGTSATLALPGITTVSGATLKLYKRAKNIRIIGGIWDRQDNVGVDVDKHAICMRRVDGLTVADIELRSVQPPTGTVTGKYGINVGDVMSWRIERITAPTSVQADLLHVNGPAYRGVIREISGYSHDDFIGITPMDYAAYSDVYGPVVDLDIVDVAGDPGGAVMVKLCGSQEAGAYLDRIRIRNVSRLGTDTVNSFIAVNLKSDCGTLDAREISVSGLQGRILTDRGYIKSLTVTDSRLANPTKSFHLIDLVGTDVETLNISNVSNELTASSAGALVLLEPYSTTHRAKVGALHISNVVWKTNSSYLLLMNTDKADVTSLKMSNVRHHNPGGGGGIISANVAGATLVDAFLSNVETVNSAWLGDLATVTRFNLNGYRGVQLFRLRPTANVVIRGAGIELTSTTLTVDAGGVLRSLALDLPVDVSKLTKTAGDRATNNNAALACGAGPVITDGTSWKHLYTGATY